MNFCENGIHAVDTASRVGPLNQDILGFHAVNHTGRGQNIDNADVILRQCRLMRPIVLKTLIGASRSRCFSMSRCICDTNS